MGWRFQKRIRIMPGVTLNISRNGVSTSIGTRGARVTVGHGQTRTTLGVPGTGISHTTVTAHKRPKRPAARLQSTATRPSTGTPRIIKLILLAVALFVVALVMMVVGE